VKALSPSCERKNSIARGSRSGSSPSLWPSSLLLDLEDTSIAIEPLERGKGERGTEKAGGDHEAGEMMHRREGEGSLSLSRAASLFVGFTAISF